MNPIQPNDMNLAQARMLNPKSKLATRLSNEKLDYLHPPDADHQKLKKAAQEFEGVFIQQLLEAMDKTVDRTDSMLGGGSAEEYFRSMLNESVAKEMATGPIGSGFGLAESIYKQMEKDMKGSTAAMRMAPNIQMPPQPKLDF